MAKAKKKAGSMVRAGGKKRKSAGRVALRPKAKLVSKSAKKAAPAAKSRSASWLDARSHTPLIEQYARRLNSFMAAMADGKIDEAELDAQERRLVSLMKEIEPRLEAPLHAKVTQLLCELTAYDIMQMLHSLQAQRRPTVFRG